MSIRGLRAAVLLWESAWRVLQKGVRHEIGRLCARLGWRSSDSGLHAIFAFQGLDTALPDVRLTTQMYGPRNRGHIHALATARAWLALMPNTWLACCSWSMRICVVRLLAISVGARETPLSRWWCYRAICTRTQAYMASRLMCTTLTHKWSTHVLPHLYRQAIHRPCVTPRQHL